MSLPTRTFSMPPSVVAQIARLPELPMPEIKALWQRLFMNPAPNYNRPFLERRIAYRLQEIEFRKVDQNLVDRNTRRIAALIETGKNQKTERDYRPIPGTLLTREYRGVAYSVLVTADGQYEMEGRVYQSLSMIAREITGTRWSGPLFFGLKAPSVLKASAKKGGLR